MNTSTSPRQKKFSRDFNNTNTAVDFARLFRGLLAGGLPLVLLNIATLAQSTAPCVTINNCPTNVAAACAGTNGTVVNYVTPTATTQCGRLVTVNCVPPTGSVFPPGSTTVKCVATDSLQNSARCEFSVKVTNAVLPVIVAPANVDARCNGPTGAVVNFSVSATATCDPSPRVYCVPPTGSVFPIGSTTVQCAAVDLFNNESRTSFPVTVSGECDAACLSIKCSGDIGLPVTRGSEQEVEYTLTATNICTGADVPVVCLPPSGSAFPVGISEVECTATDHGIVKGCHFRVTLYDRIPPKLTFQRMATSECDGFYGVPGSGGIAPQEGAFVEFNVTATDNADPHPTVACTPPSGSFFPVGTNDVFCTATDNSGNQSSGQFNVVVVFGPACEAKPFPGGIAPKPDNWGFELGLTSWDAEGTAFSTNQQPVFGDRIPTRRIETEKNRIETAVGGGYWRDIPYPVGHKGQRWIGTAEFRILGHPEVREVATGSLRSKQFTIAKNNLNFLLGGNVDLPQLRVELLIETNGPGPFAEQIGSQYYTVMERATGPGEERMHRTWWDVSSYLGKKAYLRILDKSTTGHLNVDDFRFDDVAPQDQTVRVGSTNYPAVVNMDGRYYDWDSPVWGMADLHTHPMSSLGFGGRLFHGAANGGLADLGDCNTNHGGWGLLDNQQGDYWREIIQKVMDDKGNNPHREGWVGNGDDWRWKQFRNWPVFSSIGHQQMWHEWMERAYAGGLRVMVALCVNNPLLAHAGRGYLAGDDKAVGNMQIEELHSFVANNSSFMEIAYDPYQLRDIVRRGKLAIIIGSELDDIGNLSHDPLVNFDDPDDYTRKRVRDELDRLYGLGMRYIFPVHLMDNRFGGTAVGSDMLNMATKYLLGRPFAVTNATADEGITYRLTDFSRIEIGGVEMDTGLFAVTAQAAGVALAPLILPVVGSIASATMPPPRAAGVGMAGSLAPIAAVGMMGALPAFIAAIADAPIPMDIAPLPGNYPTYPNKEEAPYGIRNKRGLTKLGRYAVREIMKRGMMIDVDHMSEFTINEVFQMAEENRVGYPLNSGHNSFRELGLEVNENHRSVEHLDRIRNLGGLMGVGWENGPARTFSDKVEYPRFSRSQIENDCAGTSKTFGQLYLYALEHMHGSHVAFGTDIDGLVTTPGPRFGAQGAFALPETVPPGNHNVLDRAWDIGAQRNGVLYEPRYGKPLTTAAFVGPAVEPHREFEWPRYSKGYRYNKDQRDFYAAIRIFRWFHPVWPDDVEPKFDAVKNVLESIKNGLSDSYGDKDRVKDYAAGMIRAMKGWSLDGGETGTRELIGKAVVFHKLFGDPIPAEIQNDYDKRQRYYSQLTVWDDYHRIFGDNLPMKRCSTDKKEWDINFEGVAHYGLLPDFLQDLSNVGLETADMSVVFKSAEDFAQMWTKTVSAAAWAGPHIVNIQQFLDTQDLRHLEITIDDAREEIVIEETDNLSNPRGWHLSSGEVRVVNGQLQLVSPIDPRVPQRFYRVRKK